MPKKHKWSNQKKKKRVGELMEEAILKSALQLL